jgi:methylthioribulose 1-phosphate dehydratase/enolase-phosphatase E1
MTPSGVQKERIQPDELYVLDVEGEVLSVPNRKPGCRLPKLSDCSPLFLHAFKQRNAGAVLHSHSICTSMATCLFEGQSEFKISHQEMIKGIKRYGYFDELRIPIIENTAWEHELADSLGDAIRNNPKACAVLVRRHGMYVWGDTWEEAKRHGECLHYLFEVAIQMKKLGFDFNSPPLAITNDSSHTLNGNGKRGSNHGDNGNGNGVSKRPKTAHKHYVFDIEGTTTPITFVKDTLFPYAAENAKSYLTSTWSTDQTKADVQELVKQAGIDATDKTLKAPVLDSTSDTSLIDSLVAYIKWSIEKDRKVAALKNFQGHVWAQGYASGKIVSSVYDDVPKCFTRLKDEGKQISIYSSGSREAQHLLFKHSNAGDLRKYLQCYFDTKIGGKRDSGSYSEIALTLGVESPSEILFVTDIIEEGEAAAEAGLDVLLSVRPGNAKLPAGHKFKAVTDFNDI